MSLTLSDAKTLIDHVKREGKICRLCATKPYVTFIGSPELIAAGWEELPEQAGFVLRCYRCRGEQEYPWANRLDPERVLAFMNTKRGQVWSVTELETLTRS